jgi:hypothetical protein
MASPKGVEQSGSGVRAQDDWRPADGRTIPSQTQEQNSRRADLRFAIDKQRQQQEKWGKGISKVVLSP